MVHKNLTSNLQQIRDTAKRKDGIRHLKVASVVSILKD